MTDTYRILGLAGRGALEGEPGDHEPFLADIVIEADHEPDLTAVAAAAGGAIAPPARSLTERAERIAAAVHASGGPLAGVVVVLNRPEASLGVPVQAVEVTISRPGAQPDGVAPASGTTGWGVPASAPVTPPSPAPAPASHAPAPAAAAPVSEAAPVAARPAATAAAVAPAAAAVAPVLPAVVPPVPPTPAQQPPAPPAPQTSAETPAADWIPEPAPAAVPVPVWPRVSESAPAASAPPQGASEAWAPPAPPAPVAATQEEDEVFDGEAFEEQAEAGEVSEDQAEAGDDAAAGDGRHEPEEAPVETPPTEAADEEASNEEPPPWLVVPPLEAPRIVDPVAPVVPAPVEGSLGVENDVDADLETEVENDDEAQPEAEDAAESDHPEDADLDVDALNQAHLGQVPIQTIATPVRRPSAAAPLPGLLVLSSTANDGKAQLTSVVTALRAASGITITDISPLARILTGSGNLYSAIVAITTTQAPRELAAICQDVCAGQDAEAEILAVEGMVGEFDGVALPLPAAHQSAAVLAPWAQLQPAAVLPGLGGGPVAVLAQTAPDAGDVKWLALDWLE